MQIFHQGKKELTQGHQLRVNLTTSQCRAPALPPLSLPLLRRPCPLPYMIAPAEVPACRVLCSPREAPAPNPGCCALLSGSRLGSLFWGPRGTVTVAAGGRGLVGLGDHWAVPTHVLPPDRVQRNHWAGLHRHRAPTNPGLHSCSSEGVPHLFSSTRPEWTPRASLGLTYTTGAAVKSPPSVCLHYPPNLSSMLPSWLYTAHANNTLRPCLPFPTRCPRVCKDRTQEA